MTRTLRRNSTNNLGYLNNYKNIDKWLQILAVLKKNGEEMALNEIKADLELQPHNLFRESPNSIRQVLSTLARHNFVQVKQYSTRMYGYTYYQINRKGIRFIESMSR